eukprot:c21547_g4_i1.p1 GENE.c21547_g4_i1~~c21547_g4_i1.p1  ORF type:complete len:315 (+),score=132.27 c21547_g4_i1:59-946(+)
MLKGGRSILWTCQQLAESLSKVKVLDCSYLPSFMSPRNWQEEFKNKRIPHSRYFDVNDIADQTAPFPHTMPSAKIFEEKMIDLGLTEKDDICIYDNTDKFMSSARAWWMFRAFGHQGQIRILRGGVTQWEKAGFKTESGPIKSAKSSSYISRYDESHLYTFERMEETIKKNSIATKDSEKVQIIDARGKPRFDGTEPEPRPGLPSGHMEGAFNLPFGQLIRDNDIIPDEELLKLFKDLGVNVSKPIVTTCGSGLSAPIINLALHIIGHKANVPSVYDGSWLEWATKSTDIKTSTK